MESTITVDNEYVSADVLVATLLGPKFRLPREGVVRPGIMVLKQGVSKADQDTYNKMLAEGKSFEEIGFALGKDGDNKKKLFPKNVDYFTIHRSDSPKPAKVDRIYELYADKDGKLRSIPVSLPFNEWWEVLPHSLTCYVAGTLKFRSDFRRVMKDGKTDMERVCTFPPSLDAAKAKPAPGTTVKWGERPCNPEKCQEYQNNLCKLRGFLQFRIPGINGIGVWVLPTASWNSLLSIKSTLEMFKREVGWLKGSFDDKPVFLLTKVERDVKRLDANTRKMVSSKQWLIDIDVDVDMSVLASKNTPQVLIAKGNAAASLLMPQATEPQILRGESANSGVKDNTESTPDIANPIEAGLLPVAPEVDDIFADGDISHDVDAFLGEQINPLNTTDKEVVDSKPSGNGNGNGNGSHAPETATTKTADTNKAPHPTPTSTPATTTKSPMANSGVMPQQAEAIRKMAAKHGVDSAKVEAKISSLTSTTEAGDVIKALGKKDLTIFA